MKFGLDDVSVVLDSDEAHSIDGSAPDGGTCTFALGRLGALTIATGCHEWQDEPAGGPPDVPSQATQGGTG